MPGILALIGLLFVIVMGAAVQHAGNHATIVVLEVTRFVT